MLAARSLAIACLTVAVAVPPAACGSGGEGSEGSGPMSARELQRAIVDVCADEVDRRAEEGDVADHGAFMEAGAAGDQETAIAAADYNADALERVEGDLAALAATDADDAAALEDMARGVEERRRMWADRHDALGSGEVVLATRDDLVSFVGDTTDAGGGWFDGLTHFGVDDGDCGGAVP